MGTFSYDVFRVRGLGVFGGEYQWLYMCWGREIYLSFEEYIVSLGRQILDDYRISDYNFDMCDGQYEGFVCRFWVLSFIFEYGFLVEVFIFGV